MKVAASRLLPVKPSVYILAAAMLVTGYILGWLSWRPVSIRETAAPAIELPSGGIVAERKPEAPLPPVAKEAAKAVKGKIQRAGSVTVQPRTSDAAPSEIPGAGSAGPACSCEPVTVDWALLKADGGYRMAFEADGGKIIEAVDIPVSPIRARSSPKWAAGVTYSIDMNQRKAWGGFIDRDLGPFRLGAEVSQRAVAVRVGVRF